MESRMNSDDLDTLEREIRSSADGQEPVETTLATNQRIIARVTDGIYREPWAAFRELIANAYDADASHVVVETGAPEFNQITVRDDGIGMSPRTLAYILKNIGGSSKRRAMGAELNTVKAEENEKSPGGRLLIGKIGIGLFAVAQLTQHFQIITKASGERVRTSATVRLQTHNEDELKQNEDDYIAGSVTIKSEKVPADEYDAHGTSVVLYSLRPEIRRTLKSTQRWEAIRLNTGSGESVQKAPRYHIGYSSTSNANNDESLISDLPWNPSDTPEDKFEKLFQAAGHSSGRGTKPANLEHFDEYLKLIWKLSLSLPMSYIGTHPFDLKGSDGLIFFSIPGDAKQADKIHIDQGDTIRSHLGLQTGGDPPHNAFSVTLDGIALRRPVRLPVSLSKPSRIHAPVILAAKQENPFQSDDLDRAGGPLSFEGYLYWNSKVVPKDTAGVLIRIREASGTLFDPTFLNYQVSEQTRLRQITAEIFVREGLDSAINIDRESFNYSHPHFLYIQRWLHRALRLLVNRLKALADQDLQREKARRYNESRAHLQIRADTVWRRRHGEEADPPIAVQSQGALPDEIGGVEIEWTSNEPDEIDKATALSVILEAYGVLSNLPVQDRGQLISDILSILETGQ